MDWSSIMSWYLSNMNMTLLAKWIYRYANKKDSLWRWVIGANCGVENNTLFPNLSHHIRRRPKLINMVGSLLDRNAWAKSLVDQVFRPLIVEEHNMNFGTDNWSHRWALKVWFSKIFTLALSKQARVWSLSLVIGTRVVGLGMWG